MNQLKKDTIALWSGWIPWFRKEKKTDRKRNLSGQEASEKRLKRYIRCFMVPTNVLCAHRPAHWIPFSLTHTKEIWFYFLLLVGRRFHFLHFGKSNFLLGRDSRPSHLVWKGSLHGDLSNHPNVGFRVGKCSSILGPICESDKGGLGIWMWVFSERSRQSFSHLFKEH